MAQLKQLEFVKSSALTEMAYTVVNTVWPDIENYFDAVGFDQWVDKYTMQDSFVDQTLQKFLYSYYKQGSEGDVNIDEPSNPFDFVAKAKYNAWHSLKGTAKEEAMQKYIDLVNELKG